MDTAIRKIPKHVALVIGPGSDTTGRALREGGSSEKILSTLSPVMSGKLENILNKLVDFSKILKQIVKISIWFILAMYDKMKIERDELKKESFSFQKNLK